MEKKKQKQIQIYSSETKKKQKKWQPYDITQSSELVGAAWTKERRVLNCMGGTAGTPPRTPTNCANDVREPNNFCTWNS